MEAFSISALARRPSPLLSRLARNPAAQLLSPAARRVVGWPNRLQPKLPRHRSFSLCR
jgi:hypothetical protein